MTTQPRIDINVDIGEGFSHDRELLLYASSANICCGEHAGDWGLTQATIGLALDAGSRIGIHPGYPDRPTMGRKSIAPEDFEPVRESLRRQVDQFFNFVPAAYLKPHGAFYADSQQLHHPAFALLQELCNSYQLPLLGYPGTAHESASAVFFAEGFADRRMNSRGLLVPRSEPNATLEEPPEIAEQAVRLARSVDSICVHGDSLNCVANVTTAVQALLKAGFEVGF